MAAAGGASASRFNAGEARQDIVPMRGWEKAEVLGLVEAVRSAAPLVEDIVRYAEDALEFAENYLRRHGGRDPHGLNRQQIAALNLYTHENLGSPEQSLFKVLNRALNERDRRHIVPFFPYIKLFATGARQLPNACPLRLWRGFPQLSEDWASTYRVGEVLYWWGFSSCTMNPDVLTNDRFFGTSGARTLFQLDATLGIDLSPYSSYPEAEVLLMPGSKFEVEQIMAPQMLGGALQVMLKQVESRHCLLQEVGSQERAIVLAHEPAEEGVPDVVEANEFGAERHQMVGPPPSTSLRPNNTSYCKLCALGICVAIIVVMVVVITFFRLLQNPTPTPPVSAVTLETCVCVCCVCVCAACMCVCVCVCVCV